MKKLLLISTACIMLAAVPAKAATVWAIITQGFFIPTPSTSSAACQVLGTSILNLGFKQPPPFSCVPVVGTGAVQGGGTPANTQISP